MDPEAAHLLHLQVLEIEKEEAENKADKFRKLLLSHIGKGAGDATTSVHPAPQRLQAQAIVCGLTLFSSLETS
jgi:hypothetical protein